MLDPVSIQQIHCSGNMALLILAIVGFHQKLILFNTCFRNVELTFMHHLSERVRFAF
jgi:hypothetical protein